MFKIFKEICENLFKNIKNYVNQENKNLHIISCLINIKQCLILKVEIQKKFINI